MKTINQANSYERMIIEDIMQHDLKFRYMLLSRLQSDCEYYLNYGNRQPKCLWADDEDLQVELMIKLHNSFDEKPEWLTLDKIIDYSMKMAAKE